MIIIPAEKGLDWRRAPVVTGLLIIVNLLVFALWQSHDAQKLEDIASYYRSSDLPEMEYSVFISYLYQSRQTELAKKIEARWDKGDKEAIYPYIISDIGFIHTLNRTDISFWGGEEYGIWLKQHQAVEKQIRELSFIKYGLTPSENRPITYFTHQFLHGDWSHLIGNMLFLAIAGLGVEAAIGSFHFFIAYIVCGIFAGLTFTLFNGSSTTPLVGASGAISAVLGMYAAIYELRKIRFFYSVVVYFGYFTAPALVILPVWIAIEILQWILNPDSHIAYTAHLGGLIAGGGIIFSLKRWLIRIDKEALESGTTDEDEEYRTQLNDALKQLTVFNFDSAKKKFTALEKQYPDDITVKIQHYHLEKLFRNQKGVNRLAFEIFQQGIHQTHYLQQVHDLYCEYLSQEESAAIPYDLDIKLLLAFINIGQLDTARKLTKHLISDPKKDIMLVKALNTLASALESQGQSDDAYRFHGMADELQSSFS
ncbi:hypothetical protein A9Q81_19450 [Gammaproteobacteria bacterium 42_54_T18]|nr:hypothetical protein A9Q81_19450 [Gammaproteobacteria bacterium 42_54_T18]